MDEFFKFAVSVVAGIVANCVCKWLGRHDRRR